MIWFILGKLITYYLAGFAGTLIFLLFKAYHVNKVFITNINYGTKEVNLLVSLVILGSIFWPLYWLYVLVLNVVF